MLSPTGNLRVFLFLSLLLVGMGLRFTGLTRGSADLAGQPAGDTTPFYSFHPDEGTVVRAALNWDFDLLHPPFTAYGVLPVYLLRSALAVAGIFGWGGTSLDDPASARRIYYLARGLAVLCSCSILCLVWALGCRYFDRTTAALSLAMVAFAPGAIQQAHFYLVDGLFGLLSAAAVYASLRALEEEDWPWYALAGALIGMTAAVRLNGLLLGGVLLAGHLARRGGEGSGWKRAGQRLAQRELWLAGGLALVALLAIEPFLLTQPGLLWQEDKSADFSHALKIARGEFLQPWTLADLHTTPYLDHWRLWSLVVGWPLALIFLLAVLYVLWRVRRQPVMIMVFWCVLYFLLIGQLQTRAVRYLMPMLPFMALFAGALLAAGWQAARPWVRQGGKLATVLVMVHLAFEGTAFARIYTEEDSRIQAGRWISSQVPKGSRVGVESGGFSMQSLVSDRDYRRVVLDVSRIFYTYPYLSCRAQVDFLEAYLRDMEYFTLTDVNRYAQFTAVPELFPAVAGFYERLAAGELGFELVQRFKTYPSLLGRSFADDGAEPSFLGYDHPVVWIFKSKGKTAVGQAFAQWEGQLAENPCCPDQALEQVAAQFRARDWVQAKTATHSLLATHADFALGYWLLAQLHRQLGAPDSAAGALVHYRLPEWTSAPASIDADSIDAVLSHYSSENPRLAHVNHLGALHFIPASAALSLAGLGLNELALQVLREGAETPPPDITSAPEQMAQSYLTVAEAFSQAGDPASMEQAVELSTRIFSAQKDR